MFNPDIFKPIEKETKPEKKEEKGKLETFMELISFELKKEGISVDSKCRIDMDVFKDVYPESLERDKLLIERREAKWEKPAVFSRSKDNDLEMLKTALFFKNLRSEFIATRASRYDDIKNGVDNVIVEKGTSNLVCALDEVGDVSGERYNEKESKVRKKNIEGEGAKLKYGFKFEKENGETKLKLGGIDKIPIFYLALSRDNIKKGKAEFKNSMGEQSETEKRLFNYFIHSIFSQINALLLESDLDPAMKKKLEDFERSLAKIE